LYFAWSVEHGAREMEKEISNNEQGILNYEGGSRGVSGWNVSSVGMPARSRRAFGKMSQMS